MSIEARDWITKQLAKFKHTYSFLSRLSDKMRKLFRLWINFLLYHLRKPRMA